MSTAVPLRQRQGELARRSLVDAAAEALRSGDPDAVPLSGLAEQAGVSERTLYRYFGSREELMAAAAQQLVTTLGLAPPIDPGDLAGAFRTAAARMAAHPRLVRNLLRSATGDQARSQHRQARAREIADAVGTHAPSDAEPQAVAAAGGVVALLSSARAWTTVCDESAMSAQQARDAIAWAIDTLVAAVASGALPSIDPREASG